ncbi:hypothetical protein CEW88_19065 [Alloyangia pacifica]|uniref:Uncharacterized protein n=1 Tax=Alloyangia pacifica TaxID=311180 RepID=A0A2U8HIZ8_9RHOB|nr:hypothetical protein [Alloyangia pacifica]AWI85783.1 hypothetical protein CEW88_19065 [Alloyangia pacifica]
MVCRKAAHNLGNGLGTVVGGAVIRAGYDYAAVLLASAVAFAIPFVLVLLQRRRGVEAVRA